MKAANVTLEDVAAHQAAIAEVDFGDAISLTAASLGSDRWLVLDARERVLGVVPWRGRFAEIIAEGGCVVSAEVVALVDATEFGDDATLKLRLELAERGVDDAYMAGLSALRRLSRPEA